MNKACLASAEHWRRDILEPLKSGKEIIYVEEEGLCWDDTKEDVPCYDDNCPMCKEYLDCDSCPLKISFTYCGHEGSPWTEFLDNPCIETAQNMVDILERLAKEYDDVGKKI